MNVGSAQQGVNTEEIIRDVVVQIGFDAALEAISANLKKTGDAMESEEFVVRCDRETMESDLTWLQGIGPVKHHAYGNYYVDERRGMWIEEDIALAVALEEYDCWGSQTGVVIMCINEAELCAQQV